MEAHIDNVNGERKTWTELRTAPRTDEEEFTYNDMGTIANVSVHTKYYASIAQSVYPDANTNYLGFVEYYESPPNETGTYIDIDAEATGSSSIVPAVYKHETQFSNIDNMEVYTPMLTDTLSSAPIYIVFRGTDTLFDVYRDISIIYDYQTNQPLTQINNEITTIVNELTTLLTLQNRPYVIIGHSLGATYALKLLEAIRKKEAPNYDHIEDMSKAILFNPLIVYDETIEYFRTTEKDYAKAGGVEIHSIIGDFLSPLLFRAGVGKVYAYENTAPPTYDGTDFLLGTWLTQIIGVNDRNSYLNNDNHKIHAFQGHINGLQGYQLIQPLGFNNWATVKTKVQKNVGPYIGTGSAELLHRLYVTNDTNNQDQSKQYVDYPHEGNGSDIVSTTSNQLNYFYEKLSDDFILSNDENGTRYINFQIAMKTDEALSEYQHRYLVKVGDNEFLLHYTHSQLFKITNGSNITLPSELDLVDVSVFNSTTIGSDHNDRFRFQLSGLIVDADLLNSLGHGRRGLTLIPQNPYADTDLRHYIWEQNGTDTATIMIEPFQTDKRYAWLLSDYDSDNRSISFYGYQTAQGRAEATGLTDTWDTTVIGEDTIGTPTHDIYKWSVSDAISPGVFNVINKHWTNVSLYTNAPSTTDYSGKEFEFERQTDGSWKIKNVETNNYKYWTESSWTNQGVTPNNGLQFNEASTLPTETSGSSHYGGTHTFENGDTFNINIVS